MDVPAGRLRFSDITGKLGTYLVAPEYVSKFQDIFDRAEYTDVVFEASDGTRIPAHRNVVAIWSSLLENRWKSNPSKKKPIVKIEELDGPALEQFLSFMYGTGITVSLGSIKSGVSLLEVAHEYDIHSLVEVMDQELHRIIDEQFEEIEEETLLDVLKVAGRAGAMVTFKRLFEQLDRETGPKIIKKLFISEDTRDHEVANKLVTMTWTSLDSDSDDESDDQAVEEVGAEAGDEVDDAGGVRT
ncbi:unnamed protein product [Closterium sp. Yama58-4]|nr:unnamed protein product [Closterium sp. Yama58-4]